MNAHWQCSLHIWKLFVFVPISPIVFMHIYNININITSVALCKLKATCFGWVQKWLLFSKSCWCMVPCSIIYKRTNGIYKYWNVNVKDNLTCVVVFTCPTCMYESRGRICVKIMNCAYYVVTIKCKTIYNDVYLF